MADEIEQQTEVAATAEQVADTKPAENGQAAEKKKEKKILTKPTPVPEPDESAKNKAVQASKNKITKMEARLTETRTLIEKQTNDRKASSGESEGLKGDLKRVRDRLTVLKAERGKLFDTMQKQNEVRKTARDKLRELQKGCKYSSMDEINARIKDLEFQISTSSMDLKEEKLVLNEIKSLNASRDQVKQLLSMKESVDATREDPETQKNIQEELKVKDHELSQLRNQEKELWDKIVALREKQPAPGTTIPELIKEQKQLFKDIRTERDLIRKLENEFWEANGLFKKYLREDREYRRQQDQIKYEERKKEREEQRKKRDEEDDETNFKEVSTHPWAKEIFACNDLIIYCQTIGAKKEASAAAAATKTAFDPKAGVAAGMIPIGKTVSDDSEILFAGTKKKKKSSGPKEPKEPKSARPASAKDIVHPIDCYAGFVSVGVTPPKSVGECAATIEQLQKRKSEYEALTEEDKKKHDEQVASAAKKEKDAKKQADAAKKASAPSAGGKDVPETAAVAQPAGIDFRKAIGAHI